MKVGNVWLTEVSDLGDRDDEHMYMYVFTSAWDAFAKRAQLRKQYNYGKIGVEVYVRCTPVGGQIFNSERIKV